MDELLRATGMAFGAPERLSLVPLALVFILVLGYFSIAKIKKERKSAFVSERMQKGDLPHIRVLIFAKCAIALAAIAFAVAFAEPVIVKKKSEERYGGIRIAYLIDVSLSMDARDVKDAAGVTSRIVVAKKFLSTTQKMFTTKSERGLPQAVIPFAGMANSYGLFTESNTHLRELFSVISTSDLITERGSNFTHALDVYRNLLDRDPVPDGTRDIVVVLSDGGNDPGGISNDIGALSEALAKLSGRATIITIGIGGDSPVTIPKMLPDGSVSDDVLRKKTEADEQPPPSDPWGGEANGGTPPPKSENSSGGTGEPWTTAFDEEMMLTLAGKDGRCIRLFQKVPVAGPQDPRSVPTTTSGCIRTASVDELATEFSKTVRPLMRPLSPVVHEERTNAESYFLWFGIAMLFIAILTERHRALTKKRREKGMREVLFDTSDE